MTKRIPPRITARIDQLLAQAAAEGRTSLYEHEVYQILALIGLTVPRFAFVRDPEEVGPDLLRQFGRRVMLKIVSPQIAHKQKLGGVVQAKNDDHLYIQFVLEQMRRHILANFPPAQLPEIKGFLIVEFVEHTEALGHEVLFGIKEDSAFGPVVTLSKGGDDAEFFAKYFDPANLFLPPLPLPEAEKLTGSLHIKSKYEQIGHGEYLGLMAQTASILGDLAYHYSFVAPERPRYLIKAMDVNPFVFSKDGRFIAIDGFAQFAPLAPEVRGVPPVNRLGLADFFHPEGIAVIGVSADPGKYSLGREIAHLLHDLGRKDLYLVNAKGGALDLEGTRYPLYHTVSEIPGRVKLAVYAAPAQYMLDFLQDLGRTEIPAVVLISGVPPAVPQAEFAARIQESLPKGVRVLGPNCMGVFVAPEAEREGLNTFFVDEKRLEVKSTPDSNVLLLTQSGALAVTAIDKLQKAKVFRTIVSFGNRYDVQITDLMAYFAGERAIDLIAVYLEGLEPGEGRRFYELARESAKPIVVYKSGRTEAGARAAASHTASITGSYEVFRAACEQAGIILAERIEDFYDYLRVFSLLARKRISGNRVAGVVNAGFESTVGADELHGLCQAELNPETLRRLNAINEYGLVDTSTPFLDLTPMADDRVYAEYVESIAVDDGVDCIFVAIVPHAPSLKTDPISCREPDSLANRLIAFNKICPKPMVISVNGGRYYQEFVSMMEEGGLPVFTDIRAAIRSLDTYISYRRRAR